jgi:hypothetical protein
VVEIDLGSGFQNHFEAVEKVGAQEALGER